MMYLSDELILEHYSRYEDLYRAAEHRRQVREARLQASGQSNQHSVTRGFGKLINLAKKYLLQQRQKLGKPSRKSSPKQRTRRILG
ncbi:MAG: hypothetical protein AAF708_02320 [Deinococcota bacterium]